MSSLPMLTAGSTLFALVWQMRMLFQVDTQVAALGKASCQRCRARAICDYSTLQVLNSLLEWRGIGDSPLTYRDEWTSDHRFSRRSLDPLSSTDLQIGSQSAVDRISPDAGRCPSS
jgi:hypothetical protein